MNNTCVNIKAVFGTGVRAPEPHPAITAVPGDTPAPVKRTIIRLDLCRWYTSGFE